MEEIIRLLAEHGELSEIVEVREFRGWKNGREAIVRVFDRGSGSGDLRYSAEVEYREDDDAVVTSPREHFSHGNPDGDLEAAIINVHWNVLDD